VDDGGESCRERFHQVVALLPGEPARAEGPLHAVAQRLEAAADRLERSHSA